MGTISLIAGKRLKRGFQAVDQRHTQRGGESRCHNLVFFLLLNYATRRNSKLLEKFKEIIRLNKRASLAFPYYYSDRPALDFIELGFYIV